MIVYDLRIAVHFGCAALQVRIANCQRVMGKKMMTSTKKRDIPYLPDPPV